MSKDRNPALGVMETNDSAKKTITHPIAWCPALLGGVLVLIQPSWLVDSKVILLLAKFSGMYTGINTLVVSNSYPSSALAFYAIVFSAFPFQLILLWMKFVAYKVPELMVRNMAVLPYRKRILLIFLAPLGVAMGYFAAFFVATDPSFCLGCTTNSRIGMVVITASEIVAEIFVCLATLSLIVNARKILYRAPQ